MAGVNWDSIKAEYLKGGASVRKLSETHNIPYGTIRGRAEKEGWRKQREKVERSASQKAARKIASERAKMMEMGFDIGFSMLKRIKHIIENAPYSTATKTAQERADSNGEEKSQATRILTETDLAKLYGMYSGLMKTLGFDDASCVSREHLQLEKDRFAEEQKRDEAGIDSINASILSLADLINNPRPNRSIEDIEDGGSDD